MLIVHLITNVLKMPRKQFETEIRLKVKGIKGLGESKN
jgi:hypothetical protein